MGQGIGVFKLCIQSRKGDMDQYFALNLQSSRNAVKIWTWEQDITGFDFQVLANDINIVENVIDISQTLEVNQLISTSAMSIPSLVFSI